MKSDSATSMQSKFKTQTHQMNNCPICVCFYFQVILRETSADILEVNIKSAIISLELLKEQSMTNIIPVGLADVKYDLPK